MLWHASRSRYIDPGRPPAVVEVLPSHAEDLISAPAALLRAAPTSSWRSWLARPAQFLHPTPLEHDQPSGSGTNTGEETVITGRARGRARQARRIKPWLVAEWQVFLHRDRPHANVCIK